MGFFFLDTSQYVSEKLLWMKEKFILPVVPNKHRRSPRSSLCGFCEHQMWQNVNTMNNKRRERKSEKSIKVTKK